MGRRAGDGGRARGELTLERSEMRLEPLYTVTFTTPEAWSMENVAAASVEGRSFLLAEAVPPGASQSASARPTPLGSGPPL